MCQIRLLMPPLSVCSFCSIFVKDLLAYATGAHVSCFCSRTAPSTDSMVSSCESQYLRVGLEDISVFNLSKAFSRYSDQCHSTVDSSSCRRWVVFDERSGMNLPRYVTIPRKRFNAVLLVGVGISVIALIFGGSGFTPLSEKMRRRKVISVVPKTHFPLFSFSLELLILSSVSANRRPCSCFVFPHMIMSSCTFAQPLISSIIWGICFWKTSLALKMPKGSHLNLYRPNGVLNARSFELSSSTLICQYPLDASNFKKYLAPAMSAIIDSAFCIG